MQLGKTQQKNPRSKPAGARETQTEIVYESTETECKDNHFPRTNKRAQQ